jgi:hypothetical protein
MSHSSTEKYYRSEDGRAYFKFRFIPHGDQVLIFCLKRPSLGGQDPDPRKTHLFESGRLCFVEGHEPRDHARAEELAKQWAEYFLEYRRSGIVQH